MRCLSPHPRYSIQVFEGKEQVVMDARGFGNTVVLEKPTVANFERHGLLDYEIEAALESFNFSGLPEGINPLTRVACFDTEAYCQELRFSNERERSDFQAQMDERLRFLVTRSGGSFIIVDPPFSPIPWPTYDSDSVEDILKLQERLQFNPEIIRKYEEENKARSEVIEAMKEVEAERAVAEAA